jgi:transposase-like protein
MTAQRRRYSADFKLKVAVEAATEVKTINQIVSEHGVHPNQVRQWKKQLLDEGITVFDKLAPRQQREREVQVAELYEQSG